MSYILHIDTSGSKGIFFLTQDEKVVASQYIEDAHQQSAIINYCIEDLCKAADISLSQLDAVAVCNGPGSYTGLRVGLSTAKGICFALDKKLILNNKLALALSEFQNEFSNFLIAFKARTDEYFVISDQKEEAQHILLADLKTLIKKLDISILITDDEALEMPNIQTKLIANYQPDIKNWGKITFGLLNAKKFDDIAYSEPFYLKQAFTTKAKNNILHP